MNGLCNSAAFFNQGREKYRETNINSMTLCFLNYIIKIAPNKNMTNHRCNIVILQLNLPNGVHDWVMA